MGKLTELEARLDEVEQLIPMAAASDAEEHEYLELERADLLDSIAALRTQNTPDSQGDGA